MTSPAKLFRPVHIVLVGLEDDLAAELAQALRKSAAAEVRIIAREAAEEWLARLPHRTGSPADAIFCPATGPLLRFILAACAGPERSVPVIVVSPYEDYACWLEALEAGAHDYCVPPFETRQMGWILAGLRAAAVAASEVQENAVGR